VVSTVLSANGQTVSLRTAPRREATNYAVQLPDGLNAGRPRTSNRGELSQHATIDVLTDLSGVEAEWRDVRGDLKWTGWLPHPDLTVARELTARLSPEHRHLFELMAGAGKLTLRGQLDLHLMLRPAIQPGAKIDYEYPVETVTVGFKSTGALQIKSSAAAKIEQRSANEVLLTSEPRENGWLPIEITVATGGTPPPTLGVAWHTAEDQRLRALPLRRVLLPWAIPRTNSAPVIAARTIPEIAGGDWQRGKQVFASQKVACAACHQVRGEGGVIGPDLSNLVHRDYASVLKDIVDPNAAINPDRIAYSVNLKDRTLAGGMLVDENPESITLADAAGGRRVIAKKDILAMSALTTSLMPEGLWQVLNGQEQRDLMTFLLMEPPGTGR
jgi:putative heme-binding domain-containing protein